MDNFNETNKLINNINLKFNNNKTSFHPYIEHIRFPRYKRLENYTIINFDFPITLLVGRNGFNKTSVLQAIYGSPDGKSIGEYWFSTHVDKIDEDRNSIIYGYYHDGAKEVVECIKTRIQRAINADYWEPARPKTSFKMQVPDRKKLEQSHNKNKTRWDLLKKDVLYMDCKEYVSAYDLCFYHSDFETGKKFKRVQDFIRYKSKVLAKAIETEDTELKYYGKKVIESIDKLDEETCKIISDILEEEYSEIKIITHRLYDKKNSNKPSKTIIMKKVNHEYTEAFAGTGESRIILLVHDILKAKKKSLILIDEPEISLHPSAIYKLKEFLLKQCLENSHQFVITTHSTQFIEGFPSKAIKVFESHQNIIKIKENVSYNEAFYSIGSNYKDKKMVYVEDELMKYIVERVVEISNKRHWTENIEIVAIPGGAKNIIKVNILSSSIVKQENVVFILDGDQKSKCYDFVESENEYSSWYDDIKERFDSNKIPKSEYDKLDAFIQVITNIKLDFYPSGNREKVNIQEKIQKQLNFIDYWEKNVRFLNFDTPEEGILELNNEDFENEKEKFRRITERLLNKKMVDNSEIFSIQKLYLGKLNNDNIMFKHIEKIISDLFEEK